jgi:hypothetical protein
MRVLRSDRGTHFVNETVKELLELFEVTHLLTLAERPQANGIAERMGGEAMRHLRALVFDKRVQNIWSVVLPLAQRIVNNSFKQSIGCVPNRLMFLCPPDLNRGLFKPRPVDDDAEDELAVPLNSSTVQTVRDSYELMLDITVDYVLAEQKELKESYKVAPEDSTDFPVGSYVLWEVLVRPSNKLMYRWRGPYEVVSRVVNVFTIRDLTDDSLKEVDVTRLKPFFVVDPDAPPIEVAAANLFGEVQVESIKDHRGAPAYRKEMQFLVRWSDNTESWEPWENVKKLSALELYISKNPRLRRLRTT